MKDILSFVIRIVYESRFVVQYLLQEYWSGFPYGRKKETRKEPFINNSPKVWACVIFKKIFEVMYKTSFDSTKKYSIFAYVSFRIIIDKLL